MFLFIFVFIRKNLFSISASKHIVVPDVNSPWNNVPDNTYNGNLSNAFPSNIFPNTKTMTIILIRGLIISHNSPIYVDDKFLLWSRSTN